MNAPTGMLCVAPSRLGVGEEFSLRVRLLGPAREVPCKGAWNTKKPRLGSPYNLNVERKIRFMDNTLPAWEGSLRIDGGPALEGPDAIGFNGRDQGVFPGDTRPIREVGGFRFTKPGFHFITLTDSDSGCVGRVNAVFVTEEPPAERVWWGDPHWQTFFSDGIRCPEELYAFARNEGFLDFGAISDHMEGLTPRQWEYFQAVTNDWNEPGRFATLIGQEWTNHVRANGAPGHRNIYVRGGRAPLLSCEDPECNTLEKLWAKLEGLDAIAIPHHCANASMGVDWGLGWNPRYEKAIEIHSVWGSSEMHEEDGNLMPIRACGGETKGRHVRDALAMGFRFGFVGGGDIHDGRPGDDMHNESYPPREFESHPQGFTAALAPDLSRESVYDAMKSGRTYATTKRRIYLEAEIAERNGGEATLRLRAASEDGIREAAAMQLSGETAKLTPDPDEPRVLQTSATVRFDSGDDYVYIRLTTKDGHMAWSSPAWRDERETT